MSQKVNLFLGQVPFTTRVSCAAVQEEQLRLCVFQAPQLNPAPSDDIIRALALAWWYTAFICQ